VVAVALTLAYGWGGRVSAWAVLIPIWVGSGLLAPIAVGVPATLAIQALYCPAPAASSADGLHLWVYVLVYGGFTVQAAGLAGGFVLYARRRWPELSASGPASYRWDRPTGDTPPWPAPPAWPPWPTLASPELGAWRRPGPRRPG
jgi:hypothetical protein